MSLFPAYSTKDAQSAPADSSDGRTVQSKSTDQTQEWFSNTSFVPAPMTTDRHSDSDIEIIASKPFTKKKKREQPGGRHRKDRRRQKSRTPTTAAVAPSSLKFSKRYGGQIPVTFDFFEDSRADNDNVGFGHAYERDVSSYRYSSRCVFDGMASTSKQIDHVAIELFGVGRAPNDNSGKERYFLKRRRGTEETLIPQKQLCLPGDESVGILPISTISRQIFEDLETLDETEREWKRMNVYYSKRLSEEPHNIQLWCEFIAVQDRNHLADTGGRVASKETTRLFNERKLAIIDRAVSENPSSAELVSMRLSVAAESGLWQPDRVTSEWRRALFTHVNVISMWREYFRFLLSGAQSSVTMNGVLHVYDETIKKMQSLLAGKMVSHKAHPETASFVAELILGRSLLLYHSGYIERSFASLQSVIEFNVFVPEFCQKLAGNQKRAQFESYWSFDCPRFGQDGARHWDDVTRTPAGSTTESQMAENEVASVDAIEQRMIDEAKAHGQVSENGCSGSRIWIQLEQLRTEQFWLPALTHDDVDPERAVLYDDVSPVCIDLGSVEITMTLLLGWLHTIFDVDLERFMLKEPVSHFSTVNGAIQDCLDAELRLERPLVLHRNRELVIRSILDQALAAQCFRSEPVSFQTLVAVRFSVEQQLLAGDIQLDSKSRKKAFKSFAKHLLSSLPSDMQNSIPFYAEYARGYLLLGECDESVKLVESVLCSVPSTDFLQPNVPLNGLGALQLVSTYVDACVLQYAETDESFTWLSTLPIMIRSTLTTGQLTSIQSETDHEALVESFSNFFQKTDCVASELCWLGSSGFLVIRLLMILDIISNDGRKVSNIMDQLESLAEKLSLSDSPSLRHCFSDVILSCITLLDRLPRYCVLVRGSKLYLIQRALDVLPSDFRLLRAYSQLMLRGDLTVRLRRHFIHTTAKGVNSDEFWLAQVAFEHANAFRVKSYGSLLRCLRAAVTARPGCSILWLVAMNACSQFGLDINFFCYSALRQCWFSKATYLYCISLKPKELQDIVDAMIEKEIRIRLPMEELEMMLEAEAADSGNEEDEEEEEESGVEQTETIVDPVVLSP